MSTWKDRPATKGPWEAKHYPEGSIIQRVGSDRSILANSGGTPCFSEADANLIVDAVNAIDQLRQRLLLAETVCTIFGWTALGDNSDESMAVAQAYQDWSQLCGAPEPDDEWRARIRELADRRDVNRAKALAAAGVVHHPI